MLSHEENEILTRVGPGTPMGNLMREYWIPAVRSDELPVPDGDPVRVRLLCENLIAFRATSGKVGLLQSHCPHRGTSLFFGRNEQEGLRCVYHGWKYDTTGQCVDMPSEPLESNFKSKVKARAYPCVERGGVVWTYMGPREVPPPLPDIEPNMVASFVETQQAECNWLQSMENNMDTTHLSFLHYGSVGDAEARRGDGELGRGGIYSISDRSPRYNVIETASGASYAASRVAPENRLQYRIMHFHFPFFTQSPQADLHKNCRFVAVVPMDDTHTMIWQMWTEPRTYNRTELLPNTSDLLGRFRPAVNLANDLNIDREIQRTDKTTMGFTGINTFNNQDRGITESQGPIVDRTTEHLGTIDEMIIRVRRLLIGAAKALRDDGVLPPGVDQPEVYRQRSGTIVLPKEIDVWEATRELCEGFKDVKVGAVH